MTDARPGSTYRARALSADGEPTLKRPAIKAPPVVEPWYVRMRRSRDFIPLALLAAFLFVSLITVLIQARKYGLTIDESLQQRYGTYVLKWYTSLGKDTGFITAFSAAEHQPEHGGIFDAWLVAVQDVVKHFSAHINPWLVRHVLTGLAGWVGIIGIALCGFEIGGPWVAFAAAVGLWLFPRYYGSMFNNPKDVPATATFTFVVWATLLLIKHWKRRERALGMSVLLGFFIGAATAIRATALSWFVVRVALLVAWWVLNGRTALRERRIVAELAQQAVVAETIGVSTLLTTMALWPWIFINPFQNLLESISVLSHYPWIGPVLLNGAVYQSTDLPLSYIPTWIVIGSPPMLLALALLGVVVILAETVRRRRIDAPVWTSLAGFAISLALLMLIHPVLYDTLRQFLYIFPLLILVAAYGLIRSVVWLLNQRRQALRWVAIALVALTLVSYVQVAADMVALSPYEYAYFSPLVGGIRGASGKYETDYYGTCTKAAAAWLTDNYQHYSSAPSLTVDSSFLLETMLRTYLPAHFQFNSKNPDFFIGFTRYNNDQLYPNYRVIDVVSTEGAPLCVIKVNPAISPRG